jgi:alpha-L-fucosidase
MHRLTSLFAGAIIAVVAAAADPGLAQTNGVPRPNPLLASGGNASDYDMAPETRLSVVQAAVAAIPDKIPPGPVSPTWESLKAYYKVPSWFNEAKFGLFMHWGLYSVPAHHNEWYKQYMYGAGLAWHTQHFGAPDIFGYKDFIPQFTAKIRPRRMGEIVQESGANMSFPPPSITIIFRCGTASSIRTTR